MTPDKTPSDAEILDVWASFVGDPTPKLPLTDADKIEFARAVLAKWGSPVVAGEPYAYAVYFPDQPTEELVHDLDDLCDDLTNREHTITELYTTPQPTQEHAGAMRIAEGLLSPAIAALDRARIRDIFMAHGFTVKDGQTDLKQYVYDAADALLRAARASAESVLEDADRYRWLRERSSTMFVNISINGEGAEIAATLDSAVDAARKQGANHD